MSNPVHRRIVTGQETDPFLLLKQLVKPEYLKQPVTPLDVFREHKPTVPVRKPKQWTDPYDKNAAYLGVLASISLGIGEPTHIQSRESYLQFPCFPTGVWEIDVPGSWWQWPLKLVPKGKSWQYSPVINYLVENGIPFTCREGFYFEESKRITSKLYDYLKELRERDKEAAKQAYTHLFGLLAHKLEKPYPGSIYRPDWLGMIIAESKVRIHRQAIQAWKQDYISWPVGWRVDCLYYNHPVMYFEEKIGTGIGEWKHEKRVS